ncbi:hypothetical protein U9M48_018565 [Paspalum notatum var. saurae]|uniref:F-box domain-containing protein n=1 Tax=Paspalum notatum var. saurae TaxID=547442 RepID=A0AAQ3T9N6_PASNO
MASIIAEIFGSFPGHHHRTSATSLSSAVAATPTADGVDRISALPNDLLREIVSRLPVRDAARTAVLASRWRGLWRSTPLVLRDDDLFPASQDDSETARAAASARIGRVLADHPGHFAMVHLTRSAFASREAELAEWAGLLVDKGVRDLVLYDDIDPTAPVPRVRLPADILRCASLRRLFLGTWTFPDIAGAHVFPELKELGLCSTDTGDHDLDHMLACSPKLETLSIVFTVMPGCVRIRSKSLQCMLFLMSSAKEIAVLDAPRLQRLIMHEAWKHFGWDATIVVKIGRAPELSVLGYLVPAAHQLRIGNVVINAETRESPSSILPSVKILGLRVNFSVFKDVNMMPSFLRCFPNVETLHIQSAFAGEATGSHLAEFWLEARPIECLRCHTKKIVIHEFRGNQGEFEFLQFIANNRAEKMDSVLLLWNEEKHSSLSEDGVVEIKRRLDHTLMAARCIVLLQGPKAEKYFDVPRLSDLSVQDPFSM